MTQEALPEKGPGPLPTSFAVGSAPYHYILIDLATTKALGRRQPANGIPLGTDPHENENGTRFDRLKSKAEGMVDGQAGVREQLVSLEAECTETIGIGRERRLDDL